MIPGNEIPAFKQSIMTSETLQKLISDGDGYLREMIRRAK
jgi:hypothetical protein